VAQDRQSLESQTDVIADVLRDTYSDYYRNLANSLTATTISGPSTVTVSTPLAATTAPAQTQPQQLTVAYPNMLPGVTENVTYSLAGLQDITPSQDNSGVIWLGALALGAYLCFGK